MLILLIKFYIVTAKYAPYLDHFFEIEPETDASDKSLNADMRRMWNKGQNLNDKTKIYNPVCKELADDFVEFNSISLN